VYDDVGISPYEAGEVLPRQAARIPVHYDIRVSLYGAGEVLPREAASSLCMMKSGYRHMGLVRSYLEKWPAACAR